MTATPASRDRGTGDADRGGDDNDDKTTTIAFPPAHASIYQKLTIVSLSQAHDKRSKKAEAS
jgi:hypothetical protein